MFDEPLIADGVASVLGVLAAIDLDDKPFLSADKVDHVRPDRLLTHELLKSAERPRTKASPKLSFGERRVFRNCLAKRVFATSAPRMRRGPLIPTFSPHAGRRSRERLDEATLPRHCTPCGADLARDR